MQRVTRRPGPPGGRRILSGRTGATKEAPRPATQSGPMTLSRTEADRAMTSVVAGGRPTRRAGARAVAAPTWWADVAGSVAVLSLLVVTALWTADRGVQELLAGPATGLTSAGRLTGLLSADLLLHPGAADGPGAADRARASARTGSPAGTGWPASPRSTCCSPTCVLITLGYAGTARQGVLAELWHAGHRRTPGCCWPPRRWRCWCWSWSPRCGRPGAGCATSPGTCCTSTPTSGIGLALPHQLWTGADFVASPAARAYWWTAVPGRRWAACWSTGSACRPGARCGTGSR